MPYGTTARELAYIIHRTGRKLHLAVEAGEKKRVGEDYTFKDRDVISIVSAKKELNSTCQHWMLVRLYL